MLAMRYIHKSGTGRQSICHDGLLIDVVLGLIANQNSILGRSWIYVIQFSLCIRRWKPARVAVRSFVAAVWSGRSFCFESGSHQQIFLLRFRARPDGSALASPYQTQRQDHDKDIRK